jgi:environmental stress-induced protein Ves
MLSMIQYTYFPPEQFVAAKWANGTTTELYKYPASSDFLKRDFIFRISTATVEAPKSTFSDFSGLTRILMVLEGQLQLTHVGRYTKELQPYEQDTFDGAWATTSEGIVRDFNFMFNAHATGQLHAIALESDQEWNFNSEYTTVLIFVHTGEYQFRDLNLPAESLLVIAHANTEQIDFTCVEPGHLIVSEVALR